MRPVLRHGVFFCLIFIGTGVSAPYAPVWLKSVGLSAEVIGLIIAAPMVLRPLVAPPIAVWADGFRLRRVPITLLALVAGLSYGLMLLVKGALAWAALWFIAATAIAAAQPLADVLTLRRAEKERFAYSTARGLGSAGYVSGNVLGGAALTPFGPALALVWPMALAFCAALGARFVLPPEPVGEDGDKTTLNERVAANVDLLKDPAFVLLISACSLIQGAHALYYTFSAIDWTRRGVPHGMVGVLWGTSVGAEVAFFWFGGRLRRALGGGRLVVLGAVGGMIRWTAFAFEPPLWALFPLQLLHALTFTATFTGSLDLIERLAPRRHASSAQILVASISFGTVTGLATMAAGWLYARFGGQAYFAMSLMAGMGFVFAVLLARKAPRLKEI